MLTGRQTKMLHRYHPTSSNDLTKDEVKLLNIGNTTEMDAEVCYLAFMQKRLVQK